jgi:hypothetical protein
MTDKLQALAIEKELIEKDIKLFKVEHDRISAHNLNLIRTNRSKEEKIDKLTSQLNSMREKYDSELEQLKMELGNSQEDSVFQISVRESLLHNLRTKHKRFEELQQENKEIRRTINEIIGTFNAEEIDHATEMHRMNVEMRKSRDQMEANMRRELNKLDEFNKNEAFELLEEDSKQQLLVNVKMKDSIYLQNVGIANLSIRLERQKHLFDKTKQEILALNQRAKALRNHLGEMHLHKLNQEEQLDVLLERKRQLLEKETEFYNILDDNPSMETLEAELASAMEAKPYEISIADMWKHRKEMLESAQRALRPVDNEERMGHFDAASFTLTEFGDKSDCLSPMPSSQKNSRFGAGSPRKSQAQSIGRKSFQQNNFAKSVLLGASPRQSHVAMNMNMNMNTGRQTHCSTGKNTQRNEGSRRQSTVRTSMGKSPKRRKSYADTEESARSRLFAVQKAMTDAHLAKVFKVIQGKESVLLSDSTSKGDQNMAAWACSEVMRIWRESEAKRVRLVKQKHFDNLGFIYNESESGNSTKDVSVKDITNIENKKVEEYTSVTGVNVEAEEEEDVTPIYTEDTLDDLLSELTDNEPYDSCTQEVKPVLSEGNPDKHRLTLIVDRAERAEFEKYWNDIMGYSAVPLQPQNPTLEKAEWYGKKKKPSAFPKPQVSLEFYGTPLRDSFAGKYGIQALKPQEGALWPPIITRSLERVLFKEPLGADTKKREAIADSQKTIDTESCLPSREALKRSASQSAMSSHEALPDGMSASELRRGMHNSSMKMKVSSLPSPMQSRSDTESAPQLQSATTTPSSFSQSSMSSSFQKSPQVSMFSPAMRPFSPSLEPSPDDDMSAFGADIASPEVQEKRKLPNMPVSWKEGLMDDQRSKAPVSAASILALAKSSPMSSCATSARNSEVEGIRDTNSIEQVHAIDPLAPKKSFRRISSMHGSSRIDAAGLGFALTGRSSVVSDAEGSPASPVGTPNRNGRLSNASINKLPAGLRKSLRA